MKCISCNAPVVETVEDEYVCVDCGDSPIEERDAGETASRRKTRAEPNGEVS